jgi:hypothetical protein
MATRIPTLKIDTKSVQALQTVAERPFYAGVGVTDLAVGAVRDYLAELQARAAGLGKDVQKNVASLDLQPKTLRDGAVTVVTTRVDALQGEVRTVPARVQNLVDDNVALFEGTYGDLVKRGETLVGRIRRQKSTQDTVKAAETTVAKAKTTKTQATKASKATAKKATSTAKKRSTAPRSSAKATTTTAKKTASAATEAVADAAAKVGD